MEGTILVFAIFMQYCNFDNKSHEKGKREGIALFSLTPPPSVFAPTTQAKF